MNVVLTTEQSSRGELDRSLSLMDDGEGLEPSEAPLTPERDILTPYLKTDPVAAGQW